MEADAVGVSDVFGMATTWVVEFIAFATADVGGAGGGIGAVPYAGSDVG